MLSCGSRIILFFLFSVLAHDTRLCSASPRSVNKLGEHNSLNGRNSVAHAGFLLRLTRAASADWVFILA